MTELEKMWTELEAHQPTADRKGYGEAWAHMCSERTQEDANAAFAAALAAAASSADAYAYAAHAANAARAALAAYAHTSNAAAADRNSKRAIANITKANEDLT